MSFHASRCGGTLPFMDENPPAGWYPDPDEPANRRYWDGQKWVYDPTPAGWYPDATMPGTQRYWNGQDWSDHVAPTSAKKQASVFTQARVIALGILMAVGVLWFVFAGPLSKPSGLECAAQIAGEATGQGYASPDCDKYRTAP